MSRHESLTLKEKFVRGAAATTAALGLFGLAGCANNAEAAPSPSATTSTEAPSPVASPSKTTETPTPKPVETQKPSSNLVVDYNGFANWDNIQVPANPMYEHDREGSQVWLCDKFFADNGLTNPNFNYNLQEWKGEEITAYIQPRLELAWKLNMDKSNPENAKVADHLLSCLTAGSGSDAYKQLSIVFNSDRNTTLDVYDPFPDMDKITRESSAMWLDGYYVTEYQTKDGLGDDLYPKVTYQLSVYNDWRVNAIQNLTGGDDPVNWGPSAPVVIDQSRATAP